jgi:hypothetical protein
MRWARISTAAVLLAAILDIEVPRILGPSWAYDSAVCSADARLVITWAQALFRQIQRGRG